MQQTTDTKFAREPLAKVRDEAKDLLTKHWEDIALNKEKIKLNPDWEVYENLEKTGNLGLYTARKDGKLIGYFVVIATNHIHYKDHIFAANDIIYIDPDYRKGLTGLKLIKFVENDLKSIGVSVLTINTKVHMPFDILMERMKYNLIERTYSKYLGE